MAEGRAPSSRRTNDGRGAGFFLESDMKWIAVKAIDSTIEIIRLESVSEFTAAEDGSGIVVNGHDGITWRLATLDESSDAFRLLFILNGPVGEVPYK